MRLSERCGVRIAEKIVGSRIGIVVCGHARSVYGRSWPENHPRRQAKTQARRLQKPRAGKAAAKPAPSARGEASRCRQQGRCTATLAAWTPAEVEEAFRRFQAANAEPKGELEHINPFTLLVAVVLSAQATDAGVNKATPALFAVADTPEKMVALGEDKVRDYIKTIGLYPHQGQERHRAVGRS